MRAGVHRVWGLRGTQTPDRPLGQGRYEPSPCPCSSSLSIPYKDRTFHSQDGLSYLLTISPQLKTCEGPALSTASRQGRCRSPPGEPPTKAQALPGAMTASSRYCLKQPIYKHCSEGSGDLLTACRSEARGGPWMCSISGPGRVWTG